MKKALSLFVGLLFICGILLLGMRLRWRAAPDLEETDMSHEAPVPAPAYTRWHLPEGATRRLGKGHIRDIKFCPTARVLLSRPASGYGCMMHTPAKSSLASAGNRETLRQCVSRQMAKPLSAAILMEQCRCGTPPLLKAEKRSGGPGKSRMLSLLLQRRVSRLLTSNTDRSVCGSSSPTPVNLPL